MDRSAGCVPLVVRAYSIVFKAIICFNKALGFIGALSRLLALAEVVGLGQEDVKGTEPNVAPIEVPGRGPGMWMKNGRCGPLSPTGLVAAHMTVMLAEGQSSPRPSQSSLGTENRRSSGSAQGNSGFDWPPGGTATTA